MTTENPVLSATDISHTYGDIDVLESVSLSLDAGTVTALIGPNGSGKTTLLRILAGILSPTSGAVSYHGPDTARKIGYLPQQPSFRPGFTAAETLAFYTSLVGGDPEELLDRVGLTEARDRNVEALSGGMVRLLGIAQATVGTPPVVVLDEPASGLDPGMRRRTFDVVRELADDGAAVLLSTHDMALTAQFCDTVVLLERGTVQAAGGVDELYDQFESESLQGVFETALARQGDTLDVVGVSE